MGFRFVCEKCGNKTVEVIWDITKYGTVKEYCIILKCTKCKTEYSLEPELNWNLYNISNPTEITDDQGKPLGG